jgi:hypothetical protein
MKLGMIFLTDAALHMIKAASGLNMLNPKMVHVTCIAHVLDRVAKEIRTRYPDFNKLILNIRKVFIKAPLMVQQFKQKMPSLLLHPHPVLTHWGTWFDAMHYYCENYTAVKDIFKGFDSNELSSIIVVKKLFSQSLSGNLANTKLDFGDIPPTITYLQATGAQM